MATDPNPPQPQRLPTHKRRNKVPPALRKRVVSACTPCNVRRIKCTGDQPCQACQRASRDCQYPKPAEGVTASREAIRALKRENAILENCLKDAVPLEQDRIKLVSRWRSSDSRGFRTPESSTKPDQEEVDDERRASFDEGGILQYADGYARYQGGSSGAVFMDRLRAFVGSVLPILPGSESTTSVGIKPEESFVSLLGQYHTYDSRPISLPQVDPHVVPPMNEISGLLDIFRAYVEDRNVTATCGGIYYWGDFHDIIHQVQSTSMESKPEPLALLNASLALACQFDCFAAQDSESNPGETFFARARSLLSNPLEHGNLTVMHTLTFMAYYLLGSGRRDAAYMYIGTAIRIAIAHGLHQGQLDGEQRKRQFWNIFILDRYKSSLISLERYLNEARFLSCLNGRPPNLTDEGINLALPADTAQGDFPPAEGLSAHVRLSFIMGEITSKVYSVSSRTRESFHVLSHVDDILQQLSEWAESLPQSMQLLEGSPATEDSNKITIHMMCNQLLLLTTRPLLLQAVKTTILSHLLPDSSPDALQKPPIAPPNKYVSVCISAARRNVHLIRSLLSCQRAAMLLSLNHHYSYNAAIVLLLSRLLGVSGIEEDFEDVDFLSEHLDQMARIGRGNESAFDCRRIVIEFKAVVLKLRGLTRSTTMTGENLVLAPATTFGLQPLTSHEVEGSVFHSASHIEKPSPNLRHSNSQIQEGEAYQDLVSYLKDDLLQPGAETFTSSVSWV